MARHAHRGVGVAASALFLASLSGSAVVVRHDRDPASTLQLAQRHAYVGAAGTGSGTLIRPRWVLTAAHVVEAFSPFDFRARFDERDYRVERACIHPGEIEMPWDRRSHDIALLRLAQPVAGIRPAKVYRGEGELGRHAVIVGVGYHGTQASGPAEWDGRRRAVTNRILDLDDRWLETTFSRPPGGTDLEGVGAPGDSGGPLLIEVDGESQIAGVSAYAEFIDAEGDEGSYGTLEFYTRVSSYAEWIDAVIEAVESGRESVCQGPETPSHVASASQGLPSTPVGRRAAAYFRAFNSDEPDAYRRFTLEHRPRAVIESVPMEERLASFRSSRQEWGRLEAEAYAVAGDELFVRVRSRIGRLVFGFEVEPDPPHKLVTISIAN